MVGARLQDTRLQGSRLQDTRLQDTRLQGSRLQGSRFLALLPLALSALSCGLLGPEDRGPVELFNGKDLDGWSFFLADPSKKMDMDDVWSVKDGAIVCRGEPFGYIATKDAYADYRLSVEWRWAPGTEKGNSGVFLRMNGEPKVIPRSIEAQLMMGSEGDLMGLQGMKASGDPARSFQIEKHELAGDIAGVRSAEAALKPLGEWNLYEIVVSGPRIEVSINGKKVNEAWDVERIAGPVGLQSEGGEVHFRNVRLTPIE